MTPFSLAIFFAVPHEAALLRKKLKFQWQKKGEGLFIGQTEFKQKKIFLACLGMGKVAVKKNLSFLFSQFSFSQAVMAGYAGGLDPTLELGDVIFSSFTLNSLKFKQGNIISLDGVIATIEQKQKLFQETKAIICDMEYETATLLCRQKGIILHSLRAVSDTAKENLPATALAKAYDLDQQRSTPLKLFFYLLSHPYQIGPFFSFVQKLSHAQKSLTQAIFFFLEETQSQT